MRARQWLRRRQKALLIEAALARGLVLGLFWLLLLLYRGLPPIFTRFDALGLYATLWLGSLGLSLLLWAPRPDPFEEDRELKLEMGLPTLLEAEEREGRRGTAMRFTPMLRAWVEGRIPQAGGLRRRAARKLLRRWVSILLLLLWLLFWLLLLPGGRGGELPDPRPGGGEQGRVPGESPSRSQAPPPPPKAPEQSRKKKPRRKARNKPPGMRPPKIEVEDKVVLPSFREGKGESGRQAPRFGRAPKERPEGQGSLRRGDKAKARENERQRAEWRERLKRSLERGKLSPFEAEWLRAWGRLLEKRGRGGGK
ncbi:MAG TPA: hypothetical protein ENK02_09495 [Planctomycetes bacterium]|nr:hypothetical protein [Planctomycetota bacterium]